MRYLPCILFILAIISCNNREKQVNKKDLIGNDYRNFQGTPVWNLAKAVWDGDAKEIKRIGQEKKVDINYQELRFGMTLLMLAVNNNQYKSCKALLEEGANPNIHDHYTGASAIIDACDISENLLTENDDILKLLLKYGANPNNEEVGPRPEENDPRFTPLLKASEESLDRVKILVNAGAKINYSNDSFISPLSSAFAQGKYDIVLYLLDKGADYKKPMLNRNGKIFYLWDLLREALFPINSKEHKQKMEIVDFLHKKDINYKEVPISEDVVNEVKKRYPENWKEYLDQY